MPIYEYRCRSCGHVFEVIQRHGDRQLRKCRECSGQLEKLISKSAFHLKGGGWYSEGYHPGGSKKSAEAKTPSADKKTDTKSSSSTDSKSASGSSKD